MLYLPFYFICYCLIHIYVEYCTSIANELQTNSIARIFKNEYHRVFAHGFYECQNNKYSYFKNGECPPVLEYPCYYYPQTCIPSNPIVLPCKIRSEMNEPSKPLFENGIVFYVYSDDRCKSKNKYMEEIEYNIKHIKIKEPRANIALVTNCDVRLSIAKTLSVIIPVHDEDIIKGQKQWYTLVLYNAFIPFNYSLIMDTHVFPCYKTSYSEIFRLFKESNVDISISNRMNINSYSTAVVLSKWGPRSFDFWMRNVAIMKQRKNYDNQFSAIVTLRNQTGYTFKKLSSNWAFASHGITEQGVFVGNAKCYRSSIVVTGPVHWIHGSPDQCSIMNGKQNEHVNKNRVYFLCRKCNCNMKERQYIATSDEMLKSFVGDYEIPKLQWENDTKRDSYALYWE